MSFSIPPADSSEFFVSTEKASNISVTDKGVSIKNGCIFGNGGFFEKTIAASAASKMVSSSHQTTVIDARSNPIEILVNGKLVDQVRIEKNQFFSEKKT